MSASAWLWNITCQRTHSVRVLRRVSFRNIKPKFACFYRFLNFLSLHYEFKRAGWISVSSVFFIGTKSVKDLDRILHVNKLWTNLYFLLFFKILFLSVHLQPSASRKERHQEHSWLFLTMNWQSVTALFPLPILNWWRQWGDAGARKWKGQWVRT